MSFRRWFAPIVAAVLVAVAVGCDVVPTVVTASGNPETRDFDLTGFTGVQAAAAFRVEVTRADVYTVKVTADDNLWEVLDIRVSGSTLHLQTRPGTSLRNSHLSAVVTMPSLKVIDLSGAAQADASGFDAGDDFNGTLSGAGSLEAKDVKFGRVVFDISGAGRLSGNAIFDTARFVVSGAGTVDLSGSGQSASIVASGGSRAILSEFALQEAIVNLSGGSLARVNARSIKSADLSGGSRLSYLDSPTIGSVQTSGGSTIGRE